MPLKIKLHNYTYVYIFIVPPIDNKIETTLDKNTLGIIYDDQAIVLTNNSFTLYTKHSYTVAVKSYKEQRQRHTGSNVEDLHNFMQYGLAVFAIDSVNVYVNYSKRIVDVYLPAEAEVTHNDYYV